MMPVHVGDRLADRAELHQDDFHPDRRHVCVNDHERTRNYVDRSCRRAERQSSMFIVKFAEEQTLTNELRQCNDQGADFEQNTKTSTIKQ